MKSRVISSFQQKHANIELIVLGTFSELLEIAHCVLVNSREPILVVVQRRNLGGQLRADAQNMSGRPLAVTSSSIQSWSQESAPMASTTSTLASHCPSIPSPCQGLSFYPEGPGWACLSTPSPASSPSLSPSGTAAIEQHVEVLQHLLRVRERPEISWNWMI